MRGGYRMRCLTEQGILPLIRRVCTEAFDLEDAKQQVFLVFEGLRTGTLDIQISDRLVTSRSLRIVFASRVAKFEDADAATVWLERIRTRYPRWKDRLEFDLAPSSMTEGHVRWSHESGTIKATFSDATDAVLSIDEIHANVWEACIPTALEAKGGRANVEHSIRRALLRMLPRLPNPTIAETFTKLTDGELIVLAERVDVYPRPLQLELECILKGSTIVGSGQLLSALLGAIERLTDR